MSHDSAVGELDNEMADIVVAVVVELLRVDERCSVVVAEAEVVAVVVEVWRGDERQCAAVAECVLDYGQAARSEAHSVSGVLLLVFVALLVVVCGSHSAGTLRAWTVPEIFVAERGVVLSLDWIELSIIHFVVVVRVVVFQP